MTQVVLKKFALTRKEEIMTRVFTKNGMWLEETAPQEITIGISAKGQYDIGEVSFFDFLEDEQLTKDEAFIAIEGSKAVTEVPAPINGKIVKQNEQLLEEPELLSETAANEPWIIVVSTDEFNAADFLAEDLPIED